MDMNTVGTRQTTHDVCCNIAYSFDIIARNAFIRCHFVNLHDIGDDKRGGGSGGKESVPCHTKINAWVRSFQDQTLNVLSFLSFYLRPAKFWVGWMMFKDLMLNEFSPQLINVPSVVRWSQSPKEMYSISITQSRSICCSTACAISVVQSQCPKDSLEPRSTTCNACIYNNAYMLLL